jgi:hypothetical protein
MSERVDIDELERKARAATAGKWSESVWYGADGGGWAARGPHHEANESEWTSDDPGGELHQRAMADAAHIAANSPPVTLALIAVVKAAKAYLAANDAPVLGPALGESYYIERAKAADVLREALEKLP